MKKLILLFGLLLLNFLPLAATDSLSVERLLLEANTSRESIAIEFAERRKILEWEWRQLQKQCKADYNYACWQNSQKWQREWQILDQLEALQMLKVRYRKGIDLIKLLYEKILALDHHFSSMKTFQNILGMSNPNNYPGFQQVRGLMEERLKRKNLIQLPGILQSNPYLTATFSLVASLLGDGEPGEKQQSFEEVACILDFTVRMRSDLSVIQHETEYLKRANQQLREACEQLFEDYVGVVDYLVPLENCRKNDDWEQLLLQLEDYISQLEADLRENTSGLPVVQSNREFVNLEFSTQRVAEFVGKYNDFISLGTRYYQKFENIVNNYEHEALCSEDLPYQFEELRDDIEQTIEKFHDTYRLPEIQGSRMKDLLYGFQE
ncbi:MAG: hypothetical protein GYB31_15210 [Bacteroidetes bacterium]|nr:hypothetical protein [Bacteroidota bacterium]